MSQRAVWIVTIVLALVMVGGAFYLSRKPVFTPAQEAAAIISEVAPAPAPMPASVPVATPPVEAPLPPVAAAPDPVASSPPVRIEEPVSQERARLEWGTLAGTLKLTVPALETAENRLNLRHTCHRDNVAPSLQWRDAPEATQSFVVFMERIHSDAEKDDPFLLWAVFNIPGTAAGFPENIAMHRESLGSVLFARTDNGTSEYTGPCEPEGKINYVFRVFALDKALDVPDGVGRDSLIRAMNGHIIDKAEQPFIHYLKF